MPNRLYADWLLSTVKKRYLLIVCLLIPLIIFSYLKSDHEKFAVVVDAGSSGSRCHIYSYHSTWFLPEIKNLKSIKTEPGISTLDDITKYEPYLSEILDFASNNIPKRLHSKTPILFYATAGMRLLPVPQQTDIMKSCCDFFRNNSEFHIPNCKEFKVISGHDEGIYGWLTVNYLKKSLSRTIEQLNKQTFGFLDMGGASLQIAFQPSLDMSITHKDDLSEINLVLADGSVVSYNIFVTTFLGFGANEARRRYLENKIKNKATNQIKDDCLMNGHKVAENGVSLEGTGNYLKCIKEVSGLLNIGKSCKDDPCYFNGVHIPISNFSEFNLIGVSEFWYTSTNVYDLGGLYNATAFLSKFKTLCSSNWSDISQSKLENLISHSGGLDPTFLEYQCFKSSWIYNFLHYGLLLSTQTTQSTAQYSLEFMNEIQNVEVSWTLGAILMSICSTNTNQPGLTSLQYWNLGFAFLFFSFLITFSVCIYYKKCLRMASSETTFSRFMMGRRRSSEDYKSIV